MKNYFRRFHNFCVCFLQDSCEYSIKKLLAFVFSLLAIYLGIFTTKVDFFFETLTFIAVLLGLRVWERRNLQVNSNNKSNENLG